MRDGPMSAPRRKFIQRGLVGGALLALAGGGLLAYPTGARARPRGRLLALGPQAFAVLAVVAARMVPEGDPIAIAESVDRTLAYALPEAAQDVERLLLVLDSALVGLLFELKPQPFSRLDPAAQDAVLDGWRDSRVQLRRTGYQALRKLCLAAYYVDSSTWPKLGYSIPAGIQGMAYDDSRMPPQ
ncbi:MAG: hypothetical protein U1E65_28770 [Myxococcota bacterium]